MILRALERERGWEPDGGRDNRFSDLLQRRSLATIGKMLDPSLCLAFATAHTHRSVVVRRRKWPSSLLLFSSDYRPPRASWSHSGVSRRSLPIAEIVLIIKFLQCPGKLRGVCVYVQMCIPNPPPAPLPFSRYVAIKLGPKLGTRRAPDGEQTRSQPESGMGRRVSTGAAHTEASTTACHLS